MKKQQESESLKTRGTLVPFGCSVSVTRPPTEEQPCPHRRVVHIRSTQAAAAGTDPSRGGCL